MKSVKLTKYGVQTCITAALYREDGAKPELWSPKDEEHQYDVQRALMALPGRKDTTSAWKAFVKEVQEKNYEVLGDEFQALLAPFADEVVELRLDKDDLEWLKGRFEKIREATFFSGLRVQTRKALANPTDVEAPKA